MHINLFAVFLCGVASMIVGYLWYSKLLFAEQWMKLAGLREHDLEGDQIWVNYLFTFVAAIVTAYVLAVLIKVTGAMSIADGLKLGFWVWLGFVAATSLTNDLFNKVPLKLYLIKSGHHFFSIIIASIILIWMG